jgi:hypothetical protein
VWAEKEWVYIEAMMEVTPVRDPECFAQMENLVVRHTQNAGQSSAGDCQISRSLPCKMTVADH